MSILLEGSDKMKDLVRFFKVILQMSTEIVEGIKECIIKLKSKNSSTTDEEDDKR